MTRVRPNRSFRAPLAAAAVALSLCGAAVAVLAPSGASAQAARPAGWSDSTHAQNVQPDYRRLFAMDRVHELRITIPADRFREMQEDLRTVTPNFEAAGRGFGGAAGGGGGFGGPGRGGGINLTVRDPMYVPVTVEHDGRAWTHVGMRYKGNSSLMSANMSNNGKVPFRLDFDRYEDDVPATRNQRFYGFQKLTFSSNFGDDSQLREVFATEVLRDRGIPAARAAFYRIFVDTGAGHEYWGLYTMVEDPADGAMLDAQLGGREGNLYKPEGPGANWGEFNPAGFGKKTNQAAGDFSDVSSAIAALHAPQTDRAAWRAGLEAVFDVDHFLRWLAVNTALLNWDAYGAMAHNYYLYGDPAQKGRLRWLPWDHNFSLGASPTFAGGGRGGFRGGPPPGGAPFPAPPGAGPIPAPGGPPGGFPGAPMGRGGFPGRGGGLFGASTDVLHSQAGEEWPLIRHLLADERYAARYRAHLEDALGGVYSVEAAEKRLRALHALIAPSLVGERGERATHTTISSPEAFQNAVDGPGGVLDVIRQRHEAIRAALKGANGR